jgi:hypothetical protein
VNATLVEEMHCNLLTTMATVAQERIKELAEELVADVKWAHGEYMDAEAFKGILDDEMYLNRLKGGYYKVGDPVLIAAYLEEERKAQGKSEEEWSKMKPDMFPSVIKTKTTGTGKNKKTTSTVVTQAVGEFGHAPGLEGCGIVFDVSDVSSGGAPKPQRNRKYNTEAELLLVRAWMENDGDDRPALRAMLKMSVFFSFISYYALRDVTKGVITQPGEEGDPQVRFKRPSLLRRPDSSVVSSFCTPCRASRSLNAALPLTPPHIPTRSSAAWRYGAVSTTVQSGTRSTRWSVRCGDRWGLIPRARTALAQVPASGWARSTTLSASSQRTM